MAPIASLTGGGGRRFSVKPCIRSEGEESLLPEEAFPEAHAFGLLSMIDAWVFGKVADTAIKQAGEGHDLILFVPISVDGLLDAELIHSLDAIAPQGVSIVVELSEVAAEKYYRQSLQLANKVRSCGAKLALVDFRNTNNAVRLLSLLRPDFVKFCSTIVSDLSSNAETKKFVDETAERLTQSEGQTIASDIENAQQLAGVWQTGITLIQGDFVAGPRDVMEFDFEQFVA
jgi:EAL domain-containing protein (putative c-di-GMP-specific phosphodiesterase class I)